MAYIGKLRTEVSEDLTPQLGGDLDLNGNSIEGVSAAEMGYLDGVTSDIQTQLGGKVDDSQVLTNVPVNALFTDTIYTHPATHPASMLTGALPAIDGSALTGIDALPTQVTHAGKYLGTDGTTASWNTLDTDANSTTKGLYEHANTIAANYTIATGNNALTAGPITINTGVSVTVPTGSTWVVA